jgi:hypothetical protein
MERGGIDGGGDGAPMGRQGGCVGGGDALEKARGLRDGERRRRAHDGEVNGIHGRGGGGGTRTRNPGAAGWDEWGLWWAMMWMAERPENGTKNKVLYD